MRTLQAIVGAILFIISLILGAFLYASYTGVLEPMFVSAVATAALVLVTAVSVCLTLLLLSEERQARQQEIMPSFKIELQGFYLGQYGIAIRNIGNGPAQDVEATLALKPNGEKRKITYPNVDSGDIIPVPKPFEDAKLNSDTLDGFDRIVIEGDCKDIIGNEKEFKDTYDFSTHKDMPRRAVGNDSIEDYLKGIVDELDDIEGELGDIEKGIDGVEGEIKSVEKRIKKLG